MRTIRVSPPELARAFAPPYASISATRRPRCAKCHAVQAPKTPAPITATSYRLAIPIAAASYRIHPPTKNFSTAAPLSALREAPGEDHAVAGVVAAQLILSKTLCQ